MYLEDGKQGVKQYSSGHQYAQGVGLVSQYIVILLKHNQLLPTYPQLIAHSSPERIKLHLFNDDTRPSGCISHPSLPVRVGHGVSYAVFDNQSKSYRSSCLESQIINMKLKKNQQKVPAPAPKLSALDWQTCGSFQHWSYVSSISSIYSILVDALKITSCKIRLCNKKIELYTDGFVYLIVFRFASLALG